MIASHANGCNEFKCSENWFHERIGFIKLWTLEAPDYDLQEDGLVLLVVGQDRLIQRNLETRYELIPKFIEVSPRAKGSVRLLNIFTPLLSPNILLRLFLDYSLWAINLILTQKHSPFSLQGYNFALHLRIIECLIISCPWVSAVLSGNYPMDLELWNISIKRQIIRKCQWDPYNAPTKWCHLR